jgi:hypothetical protein
MPTARPAAVLLTGANKTAPGLAQVKRAAD